MEEERKIEEAQARHKALVSVQEAAAGMQYTEPMKSSWTPPKHIRERPEDDNEAIRNKFHIILEGKDPVPPIKHFAVSHIHDFFFLVKPIIPEPNPPPPLHHQIALLNQPLLFQPIHCGDH